jgi:hypothetical protein
MNRKTIAVIFLLSLPILIVVPESFAYPQYGGSYSSCHGINAAQDWMGDILRHKMNPIRYTLGVIGTGLVVISQFYSIRKRAR